MCGQLAPVPLSRSLCYIYMDYHPHVGGESSTYFSQVQQSDKGVVCRKELSVSVSPCLRQVTALAKRPAYKMATRVFLSQLLFPGRRLMGYTWEGVVSGFYIGESPATWL
jgi:hypothetical protein